MYGITLVPLIVLLAPRALCHPTSPPESCSDFPVVDLGYNLHQAISYNASREIYDFQNISYAKSPTLNLQFPNPVAPDTDRLAVQTGKRPRTCPQWIPAWQVKGTARGGH
ncbi:hypothetical protein BJX66DRAFT_314236 [Aspergillus keveii]|uniref:Uncharacterized protein n=1 Tax=Aspergillus keveii TaxID=714993 RepID=A0ABR4FRB5_9EURO